MSIERPYMTEETEDTDSEMDLYKPVQPLSNDHGVSFFPISAPGSGLNHHVLQVGVWRWKSFSSLMVGLALVT